MITPLEALAGLAIMLGLMFLGLHVAVAMLAVGVLGAATYLGPGTIASFGTTMWSVTNDGILTAIPLFVLLGEILVRCGATDRLYAALSDWLGRFPGGLLHTNIAASSMFAAVSGSSVATAATIGTVALPAFRKRAYDPRLVLGSIAAGGTLGILIPPSINMIIYGAMANTSVGALYLAGVLPGVVMALMFMGAIALLCRWRPAFGGTVEAAAPLALRLRRLVAVLPPLLLFVLVMGSIYGGLATPTEAAALGVLFALGIAAAHRTLSLRLLHDCFLSTVNITAMIMLILVAAFFINFVNGVLGIPQAMARAVVDLGVDRLQIILILFVFYLVLGCFMESLTMMVATVPVIFPIAVAAGLDPVWFGIFLVIMMEMALITPPVGMNLYVVQSVRAEGNILDVVVGVVPFLIVMIVMIVFIALFPALVLWPLD
ncbi:MAG: TRAP transporter large permease [Acetobacteraceae bacterium]